ncbi:ferric reductase-like transmembrane domain-containing protein [Yoonia vestfoldensis]|uniref:ferric reductase-like transmembrane domain-containing protein n=1 Tax=Yoonia vestfoldensis TaxID=245188 RepID=UPI001FDEDB19|nr:ferric reductase-like transmembrane domain-containing protein [Yoonia vestfoldensis]
MAATSPLLAWRAPVYIAAGFAGVIALVILLLQPLLAGGYLPGLPTTFGKRVHRWTGFALVAAIIIHVGGLWLTSPPDVVDALLFASPTPFAVWGVTAMWVLFAAALLAAFGQRLRVRPQTWRLGHAVLALVGVAGSVVHAMLIDGTMGTLSKTLLCALVIGATIKVLYDLRVWSRITRRRIG